MFDHCRTAIRDFSFLPVNLNASFVPFDTARNQLRINYLIMPMIAGCGF